MTMVQADSKTSDRLARHLGPVLLLIGAIGLIAAIVTIATYANHFPGPISAEHAHWGTFGDFFGGSLNPILAFLGLIALLLTLLVQSRELELSRQELAASREQLKRSAEAQEKSTAALLRQVDIQNIGLDAQLAQMRIEALQGSLKVIDYEAYQYNDSGRQRLTPKVQTIVDRMHMIIDDLERDIAGT